MPTILPLASAMMSADAFEAVFEAGRLERFAAIAQVPEPVNIHDPSDPAFAERLAATEVVITSWGAPTFDEELLRRMPRLRAVFHAAGSVRPHVSDALWDRNILVTSAADANAVPVAEYTLAAIILSGKRVFGHIRGQHDGLPWDALAPDKRIGNVDRTVGIVGFSRIGRRVVDLLRSLDGLRVLVADPFADRERVTAAGASLVSLAELLPQADVLSIHAPDLPSTRNLIGADQLAALPDGATVINTARGALLDHDALLSECRSGRLDAVLDVTSPEPLPADSELRHLANVTITPHLAGSLGTELRRLADAALDELAAFAAGAPARQQVTRAQLATIA